MRKFLLLAIVTLSALLLLGGYRLTALSAAKANFFMTPEYKNVEKIQEGHDIFYLFKRDKKEIYQTVLVQKNAFLYKRVYATGISSTNDSLETIGGMSYRLNHEGTLFVVLSHDENVSYITINSKQGIIKKSIEHSKLVSFYIPYAQQIDLLEAVAYDKNDRPIYYYGYDDADNLRWNRVDE
ncbi:hypothetical protein [Lysinibacillus sp. FSL W7-1291]|uniref:hypothetical protein n=1 Tax=Lysinibacillus sp. FSL W7-1291 TaxID=2954544 RepID=UPI003159EB55